MAETIFRGPAASIGSLMDGTVNPFDGSVINYQGSVIPDVRYSPLPKDGLLPARVRSFYDVPRIVMVDAIPSAASTTTLAVSQVINITTAMTLVTVAPGGTQGVPSLATVPIIPYGSSGTVSVAAIDFGGLTGTTTANSSTVVVADSTQFINGTWYVIGGAGNSGKTAALITQVQTTLNATTITINPIALATLANAPIGNANFHGTGLTPLATQFGPSAVTPNAALPYVKDGLALVLDPAQSVARCVSVTGSNATSTAAFLVVGYDIYGQAMTELITATGTASTAYGKKAFKYISSVTPTITQAASSYTLGVGDAFGFHVRADKWGYVKATYNNALATNGNGFTTAAVGVASNTTGDVRGTLQVSTSGALATSAFAVAGTNGTSRLVVLYDVPAWNMISATVNSTASLFGSAQA